MRAWKFFAILAVGLSAGSVLEFVRHLPGGGIVCAFMACFWACGALVMWLESRP